MVWRVHWRYAVCVALLLTHCWTTRTMLHHMSQAMGRMAKLCSVGDACCGSLQYCQRKVDAPELLTECDSAKAGSPKGSPKAARALLPTTSSSALKPSNSPLSRVSISANKIATSALASHPYRPLYLSGECPLSLKPAQRLPC